MISSLGKGAELGKIDIKLVGPTVLLSARGTPSSWQMFLKTSINNAQFPDPLAPAKMKSSRYFMMSCHA
jgi:hypothetical protein